MVPEEGERAPLRPRGEAEWTLQEPHVPALLHEGRLEPWGARDRGGGQVRGGHERIVERVDQEGGPANPIEIGATAGAGPVVVLVGEAVERSREEPVVLGE